METMRLVSAESQADITDTREVSDQHWQEMANCIGESPDVFFPEQGAAIKAARAICKGCVVQEECLDYALNNGIKHGVWGGMSERQRRRIRSERWKSRA